MTKTNVKKNQILLLPKNWHIRWLNRDTFKYLKFIYYEKTTKF